LGAKALNTALDLFDRLDEHWKARNRDDIRAIFQSAQNHGEPIDVRIDLCAADIEWRWRTRSGPLGTHGSNASSFPTAKDYQALLGPLWELPACQQRLLETEWIARSQYGDRPNVDQFASQMPQCGAWRDELASLLDTVAPIQLTFHENYTHVMTCPAPPQFVIGRATRDEPAAPAWNATARRAIVANADYRILSRTQLGVRRVRLEEIEIANVSQNSPAQLPFSMLNPGQTLRCGLPFRITFGRINLQIQCNWGNQD